MSGVIFAILSGFFIALQNVFNATIGAEVGTWTTAMITQAVGGTGALILYAFSKQDSFKTIRDVKPLYLFGGSFGAIVVATAVIAVTLVGATVSNAILLIAQLSTVVLIETFGWFQIRKQPISAKQLIGLVMMVVGALFISI